MEAVQAFHDASEQCGRSDRTMRFLVAGHMMDLFYLSKKIADVARAIAAVPDPENLLAVADAFVTNARAGGENWGVATIEAMAAGLPVLATAAGGPLEQITHGVHGLLHEWKDKAENIRTLSQSLCSVFTNKSLAQSLGREARKRVLADFSPAAIQRDLALLFKNLLARHVSRAEDRKMLISRSTIIGKWTDTEDLTDAGKHMETVAVVMNEVCSLMRVLEYTCTNMLTIPR